MFRIENIISEDILGIWKWTKNFLLWDLHHKIQKSNGKIHLYGTVDELRDFIYI